MRDTIFINILFIVILFFAVIKLLQYFWNLTMPQVFNLKEITYWQAFRILVISWLLFGGGGYCIKM